MPSRAGILQRLGRHCGPALVVWLCAQQGLAQRQRWHDEGFVYRRTVELGEELESVPEVVVCEFFTHGAMNPLAPAATVYDRRKLTAAKVLQAGPGHYCRIAFQTMDDQMRYTLYYGGNAEDDEEPPAWESRAGLLLETRRWKACDLTSLDEVRDAFASSRRIGADFVPAVYHRHNPFDSDVVPFLSRYVGELHVPSSGKYTFYTSSQDASFVLVDGKLVVAAPGRHGPEGRARIKGEVTLSEGPHPFEYSHAASGKASCMVAAWKPPGSDKPKAIPPTVFRYDRVARRTPNRLEHRDDSYQPDFRMVILGDIPTPEGDSAMVRVQFGNTSPEAITTNATYEWDFGDGQTAEQVNPGHIYLHPGAYLITLRVTRGLRVFETSNRVYVTRQFMIEPKQRAQEEKLASYLEVLEQYNAARLDSQGLAQLVRAYLLGEQADKAAEAAKMAFRQDATGHTDESRWAIINMVGPVVRRQLDDAETAAELNFAASRLIRRGPWRFACAVEAADIALNELLLPAQAKTLLDEVSGLVEEVSAQDRSEYYRVVADGHARAGNAKEARSAYGKAATARALTYSTTERNAWRGAHSRSTEAHLLAGAYDRARTELERWQRDFPADKAEGYLSFLLARLWLEREKYPRAIAVANDLLAVNPNSPYADRLVFLTARCEEKLSRFARAAAVYRSLAIDYPGSPLVPAARQEVERLQAENAAEPQPPAPAGKPAKKRLKGR